MELPWLGHPSWIPVIMTTLCASFSSVKLSRGAAMEMIAPSTPISYVLVPCCVGKEELSHQERLVFALARDALGQKDDTL